MSGQSRVVEVIGLVAVIVDIRVIKKGVTRVMPHQSPVVRVEPLDQLESLE